VCVFVSTLFNEGSAYLT